MELHYNTRFNKGTITVLLEFDREENKKKYTKEQDEPWQNTND